MWHVKKDSCTNLTGVKSDDWVADENIRDRTDLWCSKHAAKLNLCKRKSATE